jgi:hypothetical protein
MNLSREQIDSLRQLSNIGKPVRPRDKDSGVRFILGHVENEVSVFEDRENKFVVQRIRCVPEHQHHGTYLYRISYYTFRRDGRCCLGGQYSPIMNEAEIRALFAQVIDRAWF